MIISNRYAFKLIGNNSIRGPDQAEKLFLIL